MRPFCFTNRVLKGKKNGHIRRIRTAVAGRGAENEGSSPLEPASGFHGKGTMLQAILTESEKFGHENMVVAGIQEGYLPFFRAFHISGPVSSPSGEETSHSRYRA
jgi:hypothetical protein